MIKVIYQAVDGYRKTATFRTLKGAQRFAHNWVSARPDVGSYYAVSPDGIGRVMVEGCSIREIFPEGL
jgi:hypothetical protein